MNNFPVGKLPLEVLKRLLAKVPRTDPRVLAGSAIGEDAVVIDMGDRVLVTKTDPISFATDRIGWYAVNVNANDVACTGARPKWFTASALLPEGKTDLALVESIFDGILEACEQLGVELCGGHTEITYGLDRPILVGQMLGEVARDQLVIGRRILPGDAVILTKGIAIEGTAVIGRERRTELPAELAERAAQYLFDPGISIVKEALAASAAAPVHAMHDPTEGGLATGLRELAVAAGLGILVSEPEIPILTESKALAERYGLDPRGLLASGALLIVCAPDDKDAVLAAIRAAGVSASVIGQMKEQDFGLRVASEQGLTDLPVFDRDEIARLF